MALTNPHRAGVATAALVIAAAGSVDAQEAGYFRLGLGGTCARVDGDVAGLDATVTGGGVAGELLGGVRGRRTPAFGGGLVFDWVLNPTADYGDRPAMETKSFGLALLVVFVDWYISGDDGFHIQPMGGLAYQHVGGEPCTLGVDCESTEINGPHSHLGYGLALAGGYDFSVAERWAIGPEARFIFASLGGQVRVTARSW